MGVKYDITDAILLSSLITVSIFQTFFSASIVVFEQVNVYWDLKNF